MVGYNHSFFNGRLANSCFLTRTHLTYILNSRRNSRRILAAIQELPENPNPA